jgi:hypothetical protein
MNSSKTMTEPLDVFVVVGKENYDWIGHAQSYEEATALIRKCGKEGTFFVHSQTTGRRTFFTASTAGIIQLPGKPRD